MYREHSLTVRQLSQEAAPVFLVAAVGFLQIFEDSLEVAVAVEAVPGWVFGEPWVVFVA